jgi:hypothetical protein
VKNIPPKPWDIPEIGTGLLALRFSASPGVAGHDPHLHAMPRLGEEVEEKEDGQ